MFIKKGENKNSYFCYRANQQTMNKKKSKRDKNGNTLSVSSGFRMRSVDLTPSSH